MLYRKTLLVKAGGGKPFNTSDNFLKNLLVPCRLGQVGDSTMNRYNGEMGKIKCMVEIKETKGSGTSGSYTVERGGTGDVMGVRNGACVIT